MPRRLPQNTLTTREEFFAREEAAWNMLTETWNDLPEDSLLTPGASGESWSVKDVMNHIATWQEAAIRVIGDLLTGRWGRLGANTDKFNAQHHGADQARDLEESRERLLTTRRQLLELLISLSEEQLLNEYGRQQTGWWAKWTTYAHYEEHIPDLASFRKQFRS